jgi:hypothetical protein
MKNLRLLLCCLLVIFPLGCTSIVEKRIQKHPVAGKVLNTNEDEDLVEAVTAWETVGEAITGQEMTPDELEALAQDLRKDKDAQSALESISTALDPQKIRVKYSPATGKRYSADMEFCPETGVKLLPVE